MRAMLFVGLGLLVFTGRGGSLCGADAQETLKARQERIEALEAELAKASDETRAEKTNELGQALADAVVELNTEARALTDEAKESKAAAARADALREARDAFRNRIEALWGEATTFALIPASIDWQRPARERIAFAEYLEAETLDRAALQAYLHTKRVEWRSVSLDGRRSHDCTADAKSGRFELHLTADREVAVFFYLRAEKERKADLRVRLKGKGDAISAVYVNNTVCAQDEDESCKVRARLRAGGNVVVCYLRNTESPTLAFTLEVDGKDVLYGQRASE